MEESGKRKSKFLGFIQSLIDFVLTQVQQRGSGYLMVKIKIKKENESKKKYIKVINYEKLLTGVNKFSREMIININN